MSQILQKPYDCLTCKQQIRISKIDNAGPDSKKKWNKFELDGKTPNICKDRKNEQKQEQQQQQPTVTSSASTAAQAPVTSNLERKLGHLIAEVQALRMELQKNRK